MKILFFLVIIIALSMILPSLNGSAKHETKQFRDEMADYTWRKIRRFILIGGAIFTPFVLMAVEETTSENQDTGCNEGYYWDSGIGSCMPTSDSDNTMSFSEYIKNDPTSPKNLRASCEDKNGFWDSNRQKCWNKEEYRAFVLEWKERVKADCASRGLRYTEEIKVGCEDENGTYYLSVESD